MSERTKIIEQDYLESFSVNWSKYEKGYYGICKLNDEGWKIEHRTDTFDTPEEALSQIKAAVLEGIKRFQISTE